MKTNEKLHREKSLKIFGLGWGENHSWGKKMNKEQANRTKNKVQALNQNKVQEH
ncbi:hypothetical protein HYE14_03980 [Mycoplasmopsis bovis]|nr:hypothetical protein [Mycoplasmopsis bovis]QQH25893.1 hypothetical protein HYE14_03980 [Mycoplasmopsis bovis]